MRRTRRLAIALAVPALAIVPTLLGAAAGTEAACAAAASGAPHAALVVDTGSRTTTYCVDLGGGSVSGLRLIQLAADQYGLSYHFGFGGQAVCQLQGIGPSGGDCFGAYPDYWGYWHATGGGWSWAGSGAASSSVTDGDVEGWSWGTGDSGATHPPPPTLAFDDVCRVAAPPASPTARPSPTPRPSPAASHSPRRGVRGATRRICRVSAGRSLARPLCVSRRDGWRRRPSFGRGAAPGREHDAPAGDGGRRSPFGCRASGGHGRGVVHLERSSRGRIRGCRGRPDLGWGRRLDPAPPRQG